MDGSGGLCSSGNYHHPPLPITISCAEMEKVKFSLISEKLYGVAPWVMILLLIPVMRPVSARSIGPWEWHRGAGR